MKTRFSLTTAGFALLMFSPIALPAAEENPVAQKYFQVEMLMMNGMMDDAQKEIVELQAKIAGAIDTNPKDDEAYYWKYKFYLLIGSKIEASVALEKALELKPDDPHYNFRMAELKAMQEKYDQAREWIDKAIALDPKEGEYLVMSGDLIAQAGNAEEALNTYWQAVQTDPHETLGWAKLAAHEMEIGNPEGAIEMYEKAVGIDPLFTNGHYNLGQIQQLLGNTEKAIAAFKAVTEQTPLDWQAHAKLVQLYQDTGNFDLLEKHRNHLFELHEKGLAKTDSYCREQFTLNNLRVMAVEYFELDEKNPVVYSFLINDDGSGAVVDRIWLGTNETEDIAGDADQRLYYVDIFEPNGGHRTLKTYVGEPGYQTVRSVVLAYLNGEDVSPDEDTAAVNP